MCFAMGNVIQALMSLSTERNIPMQNMQEDVVSIGEGNFIVSGKLLLKSKQLEELTWIPKLMKQRSLVLLKLCNLGKIEVAEGLPNPLSFSSLTTLFEVNKETLTSIELIQFQIVGNIDIKIFQQLSKLRTLTLHKYTDGRLSKVLNLDLLPSSLESLVINCLACDNNQLNRLARATHLKKLKYLELAYIGFPNMYQNFPEEIIQIFLKANCVEMLDLTPVEITKLWADKEEGEPDKREYFDVGKGYLVPLPQSFPYDEGIVLSKFTINANDVKQRTE